jgi:hypothetical protein
MALRILRLARHAGWPALLAACAAATACSSNKTPVPQAFVAATVGVGPMSNSKVCNLGTVETWLDVGTAVGGQDTPDTQSDGSNESGGTVSVACTVAASGNGFDIDLVVSQGGLQGGSVTITSPSGMGAVTQAGGTGITGVFESETQGRYRETDCTIAFTYNGEPITSQTPIAAGRIWGHISCPTAQVSGQTVMVDGGTQDVQCDAEADFLFEQCGL